MEILPYHPHCVRVASIDIDPRLPRRKCLHEVGTQVFEVF